MKKLFLYLIAIFFPWLAMIMSDNPGGAAIALVMQLTLIGWPFAAHMAIGSVREYYDLDKRKESKSKAKSEAESESE